VSLGPDPAGGFKLTGIKLTVRGEVEGLDDEQFAKVAQDAKAGCPVSKASPASTSPRRRTRALTPPTPSPAPGPAQPAPRPGVVVSSRSPTQRHPAQRAAAGVAGRG